MTARTESTRPVTASDGVTGRWQDNADGSCEFIPDAPRPGALALDCLLNIGVSQWTTDALADLRALIARCEQAEADADRLADALESTLNIEGAAVQGGRLGAYSGLDVPWHFDKARAALAAHRAGGGK